MVDYDFKPGRLVLIRNTEVKSSLDRKMKPQYLGPMIEILRTRGGLYLVAEMDGSMYHNKVGAFHVIPYNARHSVELPDNIHGLIDLSAEGLQKLEGTVEPNEQPLGCDFLFDDVDLGDVDSDAPGNFFDLEQDEDGSGVIDFDSDNGSVSEPPRPGDVAQGRMTRSMKLRQ